jgi:hypothetical protein
MIFFDPFNQYGWRSGSGLPRNELTPSLGPSVPPIEKPPCPSSLASLAGVPTASFLTEFSNASQAGGTGRNRAAAGVSASAHRCSGSYVAQNYVMTALQ